MDKSNLEKISPDAAVAMSEEADCKYCSALKKVNDPEEGACPYCAAMEQEIEAVSTENCKYCAAAADQEHSPDCQYCARQSEVQNPTTKDSQDYAGQDLNAPDLPKPVPGADPQGQVTPMDDSTNNNLVLEGQGESNVQVSPGSPTEPSTVPSEGVQVDQSKEAMQSIAQQIEAADGIGNGPGPQGSEIATNTDEAALVPSTNIVDGISRPEGYEENIPGDMGLAEDDESVAPDLTSVLHEGLDSHADNIQRERVVQMVSEALEGFKACKQIIERAQQQAPQLYQSSIMMLKAMIEMAKMLGLEGTPEQSGNPLDSQSGDEWQDPFALHPDQGGEPRPGHAPSSGSASQDGDANNGSEWNNPFPTHPENGGSIGQPVGKLPTSATTEHVARTPLAPGAVNAQGQKKYVDPRTGKESFIDMKEGRVLSSTGKPVKPAQG